jgi:endo-1,3(4)-beta-glucanase
MLGSLLPLLAASAAVVGALPSGNALNDDAAFHVHEKRAVLAPISTDSAASIAGGQIACGAPPVSSFFADLKPPVCIYLVLFQLNWHILNMKW